MSNLYHSRNSSAQTYWTISGRELQRCQVVRAALLVLGIDWEVETQTAEIQGENLFFRVVLARMSGTE